MANSRRDKGEGTIRKRSDNRWEARYSYNDEDTGRLIKKYVYASSKSKVKHKLKELIDNIENPSIEKEFEKLNSITFGEWLDTWMKEYKKNSVRATTYVGYDGVIKNYIRPALGKVQLRKLRPEHIQEFINDLSKGKYSKDNKPLAPWTVLKAKNVISGAMEQAIRNKLVLFNPVKATVSPRLEQKDIRILSEEEQQTFMNAVKGHRLEALYLFALATGMRRGEIIALKWDSVDFDSMSITVKASISRAKDPDTGTTGLVMSEPKTKSGRRQIPILSNLVPILMEHMKRQEAERAAAGVAWVPENFVFSSSVGTAMEPSRICSEMKKLSDAAGLPRFSFHALRHTFATRMLEANVSPKVVQDILGHADVTLTLNTYSHVIGTTAHEQMARIDSLFGVNNAKQGRTDKPGIKQTLEKAKETAKALESSRQSKSRKQEAEL